MNIKNFATLAYTEDSFSLWREELNLKRQIKGKFKKD